jgi:hypothetical protein
MKTRIFKHWLGDRETQQESHTASPWRQGQMHYPKRWQHNEPIQWAVSKTPVMFIQFPSTADSPTVLLLLSAFILRHPAKFKTCQN